MKKLLLIVASFIVVGCSIGDDSKYETEEILTSSSYYTTCVQYGTNDYAKEYIKYSFSDATYEKTLYTTKFEDIEKVVDGEVNYKNDLEVELLEDGMKFKCTVAKNSEWIDFACKREDIKTTYSLIRRLYSSKELALQNENRDCN